MKEPVAPQPHYEGSLKELAARHVGLVKALLFFFIITAPMTMGLGWVVDEAFRKRDYVSGSSGYGYYVYSYDNAWYVIYVRVSAAISAAILAVHGVVSLLRRFYGLASLLYPHVAWYFTVLVLVPGLNLLVILLLWWAGLRQMRARGLSVGFFGIDPARVD
jgi:hypothetical protein